MAKKKTIKLPVEEAQLLINKLAESENTEIALKVRDGEERIALIESISDKLPETVKKNKKKDSEGKIVRKG